MFHVKHVIHREVKSSSGNRKDPETAGTAASAMHRERS